MTSRSDALSALGQILRERFRAPSDGELREELDLGPSGFGLDSISLVELLIVCEDRFGVPFPFTLFDEGPITAGLLIGYALQARAGTSHA
jgi:acyl carrier protein